MQFSVLTINPRYLKITLEEMSKEVQDALAKIMPINYISYSTFKRHTESKPIPLFIMSKKNEERASIINDVETMKKVYKAKAKVCNYTAPLDQSFNPRYMILDVHNVEAKDSAEKFAVRLMISNDVPVSHATILSELAMKLPTLLIRSVFVVGKELNTEIEYAAKWDGTKKVYSDIGRAGSGIIGRYTQQHRLSINQVLAAMDNNVEKLMAPKDLVELESMLVAYKSSKDFMEKNNMKKTQEYFSVLSDIKRTEEEILKCKSLLTEDPKVVSSYIRIYDPRKLEKYKIRKLEVGVATGPDMRSGI